MCYPIRAMAATRNGVKTKQGTRLAQKPMSLSSEYEPLVGGFFKSPTGFSFVFCDPHLADREDR